ncbi:MAG: hypothetical protein JRE81_00570, partial [Deltaproteobacteria bacterium]|nr:hypothetical protein [Deltaproteobacteria bacterium]
MKSSRLGIATLLGALCLLAVSAGCVKKKKYNEVKAERDALIETVQTQQQQLAALEEDFNGVSKPVTRENYVQAETDLYLYEQQEKTGVNNFEHADMVTK